MEYVVLLLLLWLGAYALSFIDDVGTCGSLGRSNRSQQINKRTTDDIGQIVSDAKRNMDDLSEQYLREMYDHVTRRIGR